LTLLLPLSRNEASHLQAINIKTISQLYKVNDLGNLQNSLNTSIDRQIIGNLERKEKLQLLRQALNRMCTCPSEIRDKLRKLQQDYFYEEKTI
jgi:hypothetical protein